MAILLYAEHLLNIRTISIQAALPSPSNKETRATLSSDGRCLSLTHDGEAASIKLPVPVPVPGDHHTAPLTLPAAPSHALGFRVQLSPKSASHTSEDVDNIVPWTAHSLTADTQLSCMHCQQILLARRTVLVWKNLPSENWAEMMDFWHCHRPHVPHDDHAHATPAKGYSSDSRLALCPGVGMVDPVDFVLASEDCSNVKITSFHNSQGTEERRLECVSCGTTLGHVHTSGGYKLRKPYLAANSSNAQQSSKSYAAEKWWSGLLLSSIDCQGVRKFTIPGNGNGTRSLKIWIFTPDTTISSSAMDTAEPMRAVKVFWQDCDVSSQDISTINRQVLAEGELELPSYELEELRAKLVMSAGLLPKSARMFQGWNVALLPRFTSADLRD